MLHKYANFEIHTSFYPGILSLDSLSFSVVQHIKSIPLYLIRRQMIFVIHTTHKTEIWEIVDPFRHISPHLLSIGRDCDRVSKQRVIIVIINSSSSSSSL